MQERKHKTLLLNGPSAVPVKTGEKFWQIWQFGGNGGHAELVLYGDISRTSWWGDEITPQKFTADLAAIPAEDDLTVRICSGGGDVWAAQSIGGQLESRTGTVTAQIEGLCASAANDHCLSLQGRQGHAGQQLHDSSCESQER